MRSHHWLGLISLLACEGEQGLATDSFDSGPSVDAGAPGAHPFAVLDISCYWDGDADGYGAGSPVSTVTHPFETCTFATASQNGDCMDLYATVYPGAPEHCDDLDNDCDEDVDEGAAEATAWYLDDDGDGYGRADLVPRSGRRWIRSEWGRGGELRGAERLRAQFCGLR